jgi:hypothetical protein
MSVGEDSDDHRNGRCSPVVKSQLENMRLTQAFDTLFNASLEAAKRLDLDDLEVPIKRRPPARYAGPVEVHDPPSATKRYLFLFYQLINTTVTQLAERFRTASSASVHTLGWNQYYSMMKCRHTRNSKRLSRISRQHIV